MRRSSTLLMIVGIGSLSYSTAQAQTVQVTGTVDWTALTNFQAHSAEVAFFDLFVTGETIHVPVTDLDGQATYTATLNADTFYQMSAVVADCASDPEACGTSAAVGTHIRFGAQSVDGIPADSPPTEIDFLADGEQNPTTLCGDVTIDGGTFVALSTVANRGSDLVFLNGVFSSTRSEAPTASYCVLAGPFSFVGLESTVTILQTTLPTCPAQVDVQLNGFAFMGPGPTTFDLHVTVPAPPGELTGNFSVAGFAHDFTNLIAGSFSGSTFNECAGLSGFFSGSGPGEALVFDKIVVPGPWQLNPTATLRRNTPDNLFDVIQETRAVGGSDYFRVEVPSGGTVNAPLAFTPAVVSGSMPVDARRWGPLSQSFDYFPTFEGVTRALNVRGSGWTPGLRTEPPMRFSETYQLEMDPRGTDWVLQAVLPIGFFYQYPSDVESASSSFSDLATMPNRGGNPPFLQGSNLATLIGNVTAGARITIDPPPADFRVATVKLNAVPGGVAIFWTSGRANYPLANGVLSVGGSGLQSFRFDGVSAVGQARLPPGRYDGSTQAFDQDFNSFGEPRSLDLEPDDELTADFGAPMLLGVRPIPGVAGGLRPVTGTVTSNDATVTSIQVQVNNGASTTIVGTSGSFSLNTTIGTGPLTIVARDSSGRTTTLKRYFTTITGLLAPAAGSDLVSQGLDLNVFQNSLFFPPLSSTFFQIPRVIPLKLTGSLGGAPVTNANVTTPPQVTAVLFPFSGSAPTPLKPTGGETVFHYDTKGAAWVCNLGTGGLTPGPYVVQIRFWDGRTLEAALQLK